MINKTWSILMARISEKNVLVYMLNPEPTETRKYQAIPRRQIDDHINLQEFSFFFFHFGCCKEKVHLSSASYFLSEKQAHWLKYRKEGIEQRLWKGYEKTVSE